MLEFNEIVLEIRKIYFSNLIFMSEDNKDDYLKKEENNSELEKQSEVDENNSTKVGKSAF